MIVGEVGIGQVGVSQVAVSQMTRIRPTQKFEVPIRASNSHVEHTCLT